MSSMNPFSTKRDRSIDISKPNVGAVQQSGIDFNSIGNNDLEKINESDLLGSKELFPLGYGMKKNHDLILVVLLKLGIFSIICIRMYSFFNSSFCLQSSMHLKESYVSKIMAGISD